MIKALCSCGFMGNLEELEIKIYPDKKSELSCPTCNRTAGLDFAEEGIAKSEALADKIVEDPRQKDISKKSNITTKDDFELFKKCVSYWIKHFGLYGWDVQFSHLEDDTSLGYTKFNVLNRSATIVLVKNWESKVVTDIQIDNTAFHEVGELLMLRIRSIAETRFISDEETGEEIHNIIRILEHVIWEPKIKDLDNRVTAAAKIMDDIVRENIIKIRTDGVKGGIG